MKNWAGFLGIAGALTLIFAVLGFLFSAIAGRPAFLTNIALSHLAAGILLVLLWFSLKGKSAVSGTGGIVKGRTVRFSFNVVFYALVFIGLLAALNWLGNRHSRRWDLTEEGVYSLAPQSQSLVEGLKKPLKMVALKTGDAATDQAVKELLGLYRERNQSKVSTEIIDPRTRPHLVDTYKMTSGNLLYLEYGEGDKAAVSRINDAGEEAVTNAIIKLVRGEAKKIYVVEGHQEAALQDSSDKGLKAMADAVRDEHMTVEALVLAQAPSIPEDAAAVMLISPKRPMLEIEKEVLIKYVEAGGRLLLMSDPRTTDDVTSIAQRFGIRVDKTLVIDYKARLFNAPQAGADIYVGDFDPVHPISKNMPMGSKVLFNLAASVRPEKGLKKDAGTFTELLKASPYSWAESNLAGVFDTDAPSASLDPDDVKGPVPMAVGWEKKLPPAAADQEKTANPDEPVFERASRVVVFGDSDWVQNSLFKEFFNRDLLLNALNWLAGEENAITIRPRSMRTSFAPITAGQFEKLFASSLVLPELILLFGLLVWWKRRAGENEA